MKRKFMRRSKGSKELIVFYLFFLFCCPTHRPLSFLHPNFDPFSHSVNPSIGNSQITAIVKPSPMAGHPVPLPTNNHLKLNPKPFDSKDNMLLLMGLDFSHKPAVDLIQNCDLPPPQKIFTASDNTATAPSMANRVKGREEVEFGEEKLELLKALRLSQTRAREAERKAAKLMEERDCISRAFEDEARLIFCYRQSMKLLELRVSKLQYERQRQRQGNGDDDLSQPRAAKEEEEEEDYEDESDGGGGVKWAWAFAICLTVAGVGFLLGYGCNLQS